MNCGSFNGGDALNTDTSGVPLTVGGDDGACDTVGGSLGKTVGLLNREAGFCVDSIDCCVDFDESLSLLVNEEKLKGLFEELGGGG